MDADFSGYATKAGLKCSDGRTIMPEAFKHMDGMTVPLVWQHGHNEPANVLGHAVLESRSDGVYAHGYFNNTTPAQNAKQLVQHSDIRALSIYANQLVERSKSVFHGVIREVSLVLSGANPGALIDNVAIAHSDGSTDILDDEVIIYTGLELEHGADSDYDYDEDEDDDDSEEAVAHKEGDEVTVEDVYNNFSEEEKTVVHYMIGAAVEAFSEEASLAQADGDDALAHIEDPTVKDVYDSLTEVQKNVVHYMIGAALEAANDKSLAQSGIHNEEGTQEMNVFEDKNKGTKSPALAHDAVKGIVSSASKNGSLKEAVEEYALQHGIENIDTLFPDATTVGDAPEWVTRRMEWVSGVLNSTRHTPFSRIKTRSADITHAEARAKGYVKATMKKEEFFGVRQRVTTPTTVYKKQQLDRDDMLDITDFDVVAWLKAEMRVMLDEELARAVLMGDGREITDEDKIKDPAGSSEGAGIRSITNDHELYATTVNVNVNDADSSYEEVVEQIMRARRFYKGSGAPTFYTTNKTMIEMLLAKDQFGRRLWNSIAELTAALLVTQIVEVEVMEDEPDLLGIIVNLRDYVMGAEKGGQISMFDDFDIDYNQHKYLIETRVSGALVKVKSALVIRKVAGSDVLTEPDVPTFDGTSVTIPTDTSANYFIDEVAVLDASVNAVAEGDTVVVTAVPATGFYFGTNAEDQWTFTNDL